MTNMSILERMIAEAMRKPAGPRMKELEALLENGKLTLPQLNAIQKELFELRKRFNNPLK